DYGTGFMARKRARRQAAEGVGTGGALGCQRPGLKTRRLECMLAVRLSGSFAMVARGEIHLSGLHRLKAHLTPKNHEHVLALAKHKAIREIQELVSI
ncbi:MAG TPA: hypothetical protein VI197_27190, partial [Polyangiaceae bacterium]